MSIQSFGGRKFLLSLFSLVSTSVLVWFEHIDAGVYSAVVIATVGAYIVGNVAQKATQKAAQPGAAP